MRIKWAICKKDDIIKFKADLVGRTESIHLLLSTIHLASIRLQDQTQRQQQQSLPGKIQDSYLATMQKLSRISDSIVGVLQQSKQLLSMTTQVLRTNVRVFQIVLGLQNTITQNPYQVKRQQPIFLVDALRKESPFHLEFVRSAEALVAVVAINFKGVGAIDKIHKGEFVIEDSSTRQDIDLRQEWDLCFFPGQRVEMSVIFQRPHVPTTTCPKCQTTCDDEEEEEEEDKDTLW